MEMPGFTFFIIYPLRIIFAPSTKSVAGTSIGGINADMIAGSVDKEHLERTLEEFWLELAENSVNLSAPILEWLVMSFLKTWGKTCTSLQLVVEKTAYHSIIQFT
ncbi:MAG: hypothetical protein WAJ93_09935 [Candidatus Nitrosopolaris sp.]